MKGILRIHNPNAVLGRIRFLDGSESGVLRLPDCLEDGDIVDACFQGDDPNGRLLRLTATSSDWYYGFIITSSRVSEHHRPRILVTHPHPVGLLAYREEQLPKGDAGSFQRKLKFRIRKEWIGDKCRLVAVSLRTNLSRAEHAYCIQPIYGRLEMRPRKSLSGVVKEILENPGKPHSGRIKFVGGKNARDGSPLFGFIALDNGGEDVHFTVNKFRDVFHRLPKRGEAVNFLVQRTHRGPQVRRFIWRETRFNPGQPVGVLLLEGRQDREIHFPVEEFQRVHGRAPLPGDLVEIMLDRWGYPCVLQEEDKPGVFEMRLVGRCKGKQGVARSGYVGKFFDDKDFGFIHSWNGGNRSHYFRVIDFSHAYPGIQPGFGQPVVFDLATDPKEGKTWVSKFHPVPMDSCRASSLHEPVNALLRPESGTIYRVRQDEQGRVIEYHKADLDLRAEAIACYKDRDLLPDEKLEAIETLIRMGYESKKIKQETLKEQRQKILEQRVKTALEEGDAEAALRWEARLQAIRYQPSRLANLHSLYPVPESPILAADIETVPGQGECGRALLFDKTEPVGRMPREPAWALLFTEPDLSPVPCEEGPWALMHATNEKLEVPLDLASSHYAIDL